MPLLNVLISTRNAFCLPGEKSKIDRFIYFEALTMNFTVQQREGSGKGANRKLRAMGLCSGVIYGKSGVTLVQMRADQGARFLDQLHGGVQHIDLAIEGGKKALSKQVIVRDFQYTKVGNRLLHVDFMEITPETKLRAEVPIRPSDCDALKMGAVVQVVRHSVPVTGKVKDIPDHLDVDITNLTFGESVHVLDIPYPEGVKPVVAGRNFTLLTIAGKARAAEVEETAPEAEAAATEA